MKNTILQMTRGKANTVKEPMQTRSSNQRSNAKVRVEYIAKNKAMSTDDEAEEVEYLEDAISEEFVRKHFAPQSKSSIRRDIKRNVDIFYPNAVHCLLDLYRAKYNEMKEKNASEILAMRVWDDIAQDMNESFFDFSKEQIRCKFRELRRKYFSLSSVTEIEAFDYFDQLHLIYQDKAIDALAADDNIQIPQLPNNYCDEVLQSDALSLDHSNAGTGTMESTSVEQPSQTILTLQAEDPVANSNASTTDNAYPVYVACMGINSGANINQVQIVSPTQINKRIKLSEPLKIVQTIVTPSPTSAVTMQKIVSGHLDSCETQPNDTYAIEETLTTQYTDSVFKDMTLNEYNMQQERRHQEQVALMERMLKTQERNLVLQQQLIDRLTKRL